MHTEIHTWHMLSKRCSTRRREILVRSVKREVQDEMVQDEDKDRTKDRKGRRKV